MKDCIQDFVKAWKQMDGSHLINRKWHLRFEDAGYYRMVPSRENTTYHWGEIHQWCEQQFGRDHYAWTGDIFWFENERDAMLFALRWA